MVSVPTDLKLCMTDLRYKLEGKRCDISGRDNECALVWQTLKKYNKKNVILIGEPGVGKTAIAEKITFDIISGNCPRQFRYFNVFALSITSMIAGTKLRGEAEEKFSALARFLERNEDVILFIDEIHLIMGAGAAEGAIDMANSLKPILASGSVRIIGATTSKEYEEIISKDLAIKRRFRTVEVKEPKNEEVYPMLKKSIETLSKYHGVSITKAMVNFIVWNSDSFNSETRNPDKTKDIIDLAMVVAKEKGKHSVDEDSVMEILKNNPMLRIPTNLTSCLTNLNDNLNGKQCDILGRDRECSLIWQTMQRREKRNVILIGEPGVGKTAIMQKITFDILQGKCPKKFSSYKVLSLDVTEMIAGTKYRGQAEEKFTALITFLEYNPEVILYIDEVHRMMGAGKSEDSASDLANALKPILARDKIQIICATTSKEYEEIVSKDGAIKRRFRTIEVKEPKTEEVYPMLQKSIETLSEYHGVSISKQMVDFIILNASCFDNETRNPDRTKDLIDLSMVVAKQMGKTKVDTECVLANFEYHFEKFAKMSDRIKQSTAYHEAGHCLVSIFSGNLTNYDVIAVSIMPTDTYLGITVYEDNGNTVEPTMEYFVDSIARDLAGRVAEKIFTTTITSGAAADLANATRTAQNIVAKYGMSEFGKNRIFTEETKSEEIKNSINAEIDRLIQKANQRAEQILNDNREALKLLVGVLMKKGIVGKKELEKILKVKQN